MSIRPDGDSLDNTTPPDVGGVAPETLAQQQATNAAIDGAVAQMKTDIAAAQDLADYYASWATFAEKVAGEVAALIGQQMQSNSETAPATQHVDWKHELLSSLPTLLSTPKADRGAVAWGIAADLLGKL